MFLVSLRGPVAAWNLTRRLKPFSQPRSGRLQPAFLGPPEGGHYVQAIRSLKADTTHKKKAL